MYKYYFQPLVWLIVPLITGILCRIEFCYGTQLLKYILLGLWILLLVLFPVRKKALIYPALCGFFLIGGYYLTDLQLPENTESSFIHRSSSSCMLMLTEPLREKNGHIRTVAEVKYIRDAGWTKSQGKVLVYFPDSTGLDRYGYGDEFLVSGNIKPIDSPKNPHEFNYQAYLYYRNIYGMVHVNTANAVYMGNSGSYFLRKVYSWHSQLIKMLKESLSAKDERGVATGLLIGNTDEIDQEVMNFFSRSGTLHILSVSGMHVGLIFLFAGYIMKTCFGNRLKLLQLTSILLLLWIYAGITGFVPPVIRSCLMLSVFIIGKGLYRTTDGLYTLFSSAFVLLLINPLYLMDIGFQLSYLSLGGILLMQPVIHKLWEPSGWLKKEIWTLVTASIAAQLFTFPISIYYFGGFPSYFIIANLVIIPLSTLAIYSGIFLISTFPIGLLKKFFVFSTFNTIKMLNHLAGWISGLPASYISLNFNSYETFLLYIIILLWILSVKLKRSVFLLCGLLLLTLFLSLHICRFQEASKQNAIFVYQVRNGTVVGFMHHFHQINFISGANYLYHTSNNTKAALIAEEKELLLDADTITPWLLKKQGLVKFGNKMIYICQRNWHFQENENKIKIDFIVLTNNAYTSIPELLKVFEFKTLVTDGTDKDRYIQNLRKQCELYHIQLYATKESGAYCYTF